MSNPYGPQNPQHDEGNPYDGNVATVPFPQGQQGALPEQSAPLTAKQAKARAQAAKAEAKALRPWFKKKRFVIPLLLVALFLLIKVTGGDGEQATTAVPAGTSSTAGEEKTSTTEKEEASTSEADESAPTAKIGESARAGDWTFKVTKFSCGETTIGDEYLNKKAQGQFCQMKLNVTNNGDEAATLMSDNQLVLDAKGREFSSDSEAAFYLDSDLNLLLDEINPGNTVKGVIVFDVPKKTTPVTASLAGGLFGVVDVVTVDLR